MSKAKEILTKTFNDLSDAFLEENTDIQNEEDASKVVNSFFSWILSGIRNSTEITTSNENQEG